MKRVGTIPIDPENFSPSIQYVKYERYDRQLKWPLLITAGDISEDGGKIILRTYNGKTIKYLYFQNKD